MFKTFPAKPNIPLLEEEILRFEKNHRIPEKIAAIRKGGLDYTCAEKPLRGWRKPGWSEVPGWVFSDLFLRYKNLRGYHIERWNTWQGHALTLEWEIEKRLGLGTLGKAPNHDLEHFSEQCQRFSLQYAQDWERLAERLACWRDSYSAVLTSANPYIESLWWSIKSLWEKGYLIHEERVTPGCPRCGTLLSVWDVTLGTRQVEGLSLLIRFPLVEDPDVSLLVWTDAPWKLPAAVAVAADPQTTYVIVEHDLPEGGTEKLILGKDHLPEVFKEAQVRVYETFQGEKLKGLRFKPLFTFLLPERPAHFVVLEKLNQAENLSQLALVSPPFSAIEVQIAQKAGLPILETITSTGLFSPEIRPWRGLPFWEVEKYLVQHLQERGLLFHAERLLHSASFCPACNTPLLSRIQKAWVLNASKAVQSITALQAQVRLLSDRNYPAAKLADEKDWPIGRQRPWGAPLPIWFCPDCAHQTVIGSREELSLLAGYSLDHLDLHRPQVDKIMLPCPECGAGMQRIPEVIDEWFEIALAPFARLHAPFENTDLFEHQFPATLLCETDEHCHPWLSALSTASTLLFEHPPIREVWCLQALSAQEDVWQLLKNYGTDALRWALFTNYSVRPAVLERATQKFLLPIWRTYNLFAVCANYHHWLPSASGEMDPLIDHWLRSRLHRLTRDLTTALETPDLSTAVMSLQTFVEDLSEWYFLIAPRRLWTQPAGLATLYEVLLTLSKLLAPFTPLLAESLYQNLMHRPGSAAAESVHLERWPTFNSAWIDEALESEMSLVRKLAELGQSARRQAALGPYYPLTEITFWLPDSNQAVLVEQYAPLLAQVLKAKTTSTLVRGKAGGQVPGEEDEGIPPGLLVIGQGDYVAALKTDRTPELEQALLAGELIQQIWLLRKQAGLEPETPIRIFVIATPGLSEALATHRDNILAETLAMGLLFELEEAEGMTIAKLEFPGEKATLGILPAISDSP